MTDYFRVGNRTLTAIEMGVMKPAEIEKIKVDGDLANQKRLENIRKGLGVEPQKMTLDVTPTAVVARNKAIATEEAKIAAETKKIEDELGPEAPAALAEGEAPVAQETRKTAKGKKAV